jgi:hypothetical protein
MLRIFFKDALNLFSYYNKFLLEKIKEIENFGIKYFFIFNFI